MFGFSGLTVSFVFSSIYVVGRQWKSKFIVGLFDVRLVLVTGDSSVRSIGLIFITIGARTTPSAVVGIIMMTEAIFGPLWAWIFINEQPPFIVLIGGSIVLFAVLLQFLNKFFSKKEAN